MYIDFHTHAFADKIVKKAMQNLTKTSGFAPCTDGSVRGLKEQMKSSGINSAVILPIATKPSQHEIINDWAAQINGKDNIYAFGSVHPISDDAVSYLEKIKAMGLCGIKLHPDYQDFFVDDERAFPVYGKCIELNLPIVFHAGYDPLSPDLIHVSPERLLKVHEKFPELTIVAAHLGGMYRWDKVERLLAGRSGALYFDLAFTAGEIGEKQLMRIISKHGADRILFGSDCPWHDPMEEKNMLEKLPLTAEEKALIAYKNAQRLIGVL